MAVTQCVLTLTGSAQALSTAAGAPTNPVRTVAIQADTANTHAVFIGDANVTSAAWGIRIPAPVSAEPAAPYPMGETQSQHGHFKLSDVYINGTNGEKVRLLVFTI